MNYSFPWEVLRVECPFCKAPVCEPCRRPSGRVTSEHADRVHAAGFWTDAEVQNLQEWNRTAHPGGMIGDF